MAIKSRPFGGIILTGADATAFMRQINSGERNQAAYQSLQRGLAMVDEFKRTGRVKLQLGASAAYAYKNQPSA